MGDFKPTEIISNFQARQQLTEDNIYWKRLETVAVIEEPGQVSSVDFSPVYPYDLAATCSTKVTVYDSTVCNPQRIFSRFKQAVYGAVFRHDGTLLATGGEEGRVRVFDVNNMTSKSALRTYKGHQSAIRSCEFSASGTRVVSFADDQSIKCWDIAVDGHVPLLTIQAHTDYVRCGKTSQLSDDLLLSGSYDHTAKVWDCRSGKCSQTFKHGFPVEAVLLYPTDSLVATSGSTAIKIWDLRVPDTQLVELSDHHKTITCLAFCSDNNRILSGGLDKHVKVYNMETYENVHSLDFPAPILSLAVSADDNLLAVGMAGPGGNLLSVQRRAAPRLAQKTQVKRKMLQKFELDRSEQRKNDLVVGVGQGQKLIPYDRAMKNFQHSKALTLVLNSKYFVERRPEVIVTVLRELNRRGGLQSALAGREHSTLSVLLRFLSTHIGDLKFSPVLIRVADCLIETYKDHMDELEAATLKLFLKLNDAVGRKINQHKQLVGLGAELEMIINSVKSNRRVERTSSPVFGEPTVTRMAEEQML